MVVGEAAAFVVVGEAQQFVAVKKAPEIMAVRYAAACPSPEQVAQVSDRLRWFLHHQPRYLPSRPGESS
jgi:hypothetical protein